MATLFVVSTPIGNLEDVTRRAERILLGVPRVLAEDTRRTRVLLDHLGSPAGSLTSFHQHNEAARTGRVLDWLAAGEDVALVSDAGTPLVSDPGGRLVRAAADAGHDVVPVPGPSAVLAALVASGFAADRFSFMGFVPRRGSERAEFLERASRSREPLVFFESPERLEATLLDLEGACGDGRAVAVGRELTKLHETFVRGTLGETRLYYQEQPARGEVTVVLGPAEDDPDADAARLEAARSLAVRLMDEGMSPSAAARAVARDTGVPRNEAYRLTQEVKRTTGREG